VTDAAAPSSPAAHAVALARTPFWRDERLRLIGTPPEFPDAAFDVGAREEVLHALVLVLSRLPQERRLRFAEAFFSRYEPAAGAASPGPREQLAAAAGVALLVVELAVDDLRTERIVDILTGASQGDDLTSTPPAAVAAVQKAVARVRFDLELEDPADARGAASLALAETLIPAGEVVALKEVVARAAWAAAESWEQERVLELLVDAARIVERSDAR